MILYQKVLRLQQQSTINSKSIIQVSLPQIIHYLQNELILPNTLHIPFETFPIMDETTENDHSPAILYWDSSLSPSSDISRLYVEVAAIFPETQDQNDGERDVVSPVYPTMAMVIVKRKNVKSNSSSSSLMIEKLISDAHQKIVKYLDTSLNEIEYGKGFRGNSRFKQIPSSMDKEKSEYKGNTLKSSIEESTITSMDNHDLNEGKSPIYSTTSLSKDGFAITAAKNIIKKSLLEEKNSFTATNKAKNSLVEDEYAIAVAKNIIAQKSTQVATEYQSIDTSPIEYTAGSTQTQEKDLPRLKKSRKSKASEIEFSRNALTNKAKNSLVEDEYAIAAAKNIIAQKSTQVATEYQSIDTSPIEYTAGSTQTQEIDPPRLKKSRKSKASETEFSRNSLNEGIDVKTKKSSRANNFRVSISKPKDFDSHQSKENVSDTVEASQEKIASVTDDLSAVDIDSMTITSQSNKTRNINIQLDDSTIDLERPLHLADVSTTTKSVNNSPIDISLSSMEEETVWKTAMEMMPSSSEAESLSPRQLLENVIQFGEESKKQNLDGQGFVQGVLQKTKELLGNQSRDKKTVKEFSRGISGISTAEEELKKIFAAGEQIIEGKIMSSSSSNHDSSLLQSSGKSEITEDYIDELIERDTTVSKNVKTLDDELAELEIRISRTVGERSYDTGPNPVFDIFTGPQAYNPNVDPETTINWPGAPMGTRTDVRLPSELANAVKQAQFAAEALSQLREEEDMRYYIGSKQVTKSQVDNLRFIVDESVAMGLISDPIEILAQSSRLQIILDEMKFQPEERFVEIVSNYRDLLLSDHFPQIIRAKLIDMAKSESRVQKTGGSTLELESIHKQERDTMSQLVNYAQLLLKEAQALGAELENNQLEIIRSICLVAMDPQYTSEEETSLALAEAVRDMRPLLDENFVAYLKYAISEEEAALARRGVLDDPEHNRWLFVLKIVQEGVYSELSKSIRRYIDHISYVLRMETKADRRALLSKLIDVMPSLDVRPFVKCVDNIAASLGSAVKGEFSNDILGGMANKILQLRRDVHELLPPDRIKLKSQDADDWAERQRQKLLERRNVSLQRLQAGKDTEKYDEDELFRPKGEVERMA